MNQRLWVCSALLALFVVGCESKDSASSATNSNDTNTASNNVEVTPSKPSGGQTSDLSLDKIPAELKHDAYEYYGLSRTEAAKFKFKRDKSEDQDGSQLNKLTKVGSDFAEFEVEYTGVLAQSGAMTIRLDKAGVRVVKSESVKQTEDSYELPADLSTGKTWITKTTTDSSIQLTANNKIEGTGAVTTPVATYKDALIVSATGTGTANGLPIKMTTKIWLVKGRGAVKTEITNSSGGKTEKTVLEEAK